MSESPSPERIDVCTPPDSPNAVFDVQCSPSIHENENELLVEFQSPQKRSRPLTARILKRKREDIRLDRSGEDFPSTSETTTRNERDGGWMMNTYDEDSIGTVPGPVDLGINPGSSPSNNNYEQYLELALANCAEFVQISSTLFVVQGWDGTKLSVS